MTTTLCTLALILTAPAGDELTVLSEDGEGPAPRQMLGNYLANEAFRALDRRREAYEQLETIEDCRKWQEERRTFFRRKLGGFPKRTPLKARVVDRLSGDGYRIEKIIYESRPQHRVTAVLYLPEADPPYPGVLIASGHSRTAKAADYNQRMGILLARHGMAALAYDPLGQGERSQLLDSDGKAKHGSTTREHFLIGVGAILVGTNTAQYHIHDGLRGIDYLLRRDDIDPERIGCTGCSGGGTLTSYIMALDDRIACAAPACYLTTFRRLIETIGPQDAEQNIHGQIAFGLDQPDYVLMRVPRPTLICATTRDFFDIEGTWDNYRQSKRIYARFGAPERVSLVEDDSNHGITKLNRETMVHWMQRWLLNRDEPVEDPEPPLWSQEELQCTPDGQVLLMPGERSVFDLNAERERKLAARREEFWKTHSPEQARQRIRELADVRPLKDIPDPKKRQVGTIERKGDTIEKRLLEPEPGLLLPALLFRPDKPSGEAVLYVHGDGKQAGTADDGPIANWVENGNLVLAVDLPGLGETRPEGADGLLGDWKNFFLAYLMDRSMVGLRAESLLVSGRFLSHLQSKDGSRAVRLVAVGEAGIPALHAAALEPDLFSSVRLKRSLRSWVDVVHTPEPHNQLTGTIHGALEVYDLPDLVNLYGSERLTIQEPVDASGKRVDR